LVIVPLGSELAAMISPATKSPGVVQHALQAVAMLAISVGFWLPPGRNAGILSVAWLAFCAVMTASRLAYTWRRPRITNSLLVDLAYADVVLGSAWLVASRAGLRPMGFQEPIILLTAVHFHYSGFATALIAAATWREFERKRLSMPGWQTLVWLVALLPFVLAAGFVFSPWLRFIAAISLSASVTALALILWWIAADWSNPAKIYLRLAALAAVGAFSLAGHYAVSEYFHKDGITIPGMANSHGLLNGLGFVLLGMLGWLLELQRRVPSENVTVETLEPKTVQRAEHSAVFARTGANLARAQRDWGGTTAPDFLAREFYDR